MIRFQLNWRLTLFAATFLPVLIGLGFWQLARAEEKRILLAAWEEQQLSEPIQANSLFDRDFLPHQKIQLSASFAPDKYWLLEARIFKGRPGYEVLVPASMSNGEWILINRGWVAANPDRRVLPEVSTMRAKQMMWGELRAPTKTAFVDEQNNPVSTWPHRILEINLALMSEQLGQTLAPRILALDADHPSAFVVHSAPVNMPPSKHTAYAVQWFALAMVLSVMWFFTNTNIIQLYKNKKMRTC